MQILAPGTEIEPVVTGVITTLTLARIGEPDWSPGALAEMVAAFGLPIAEMQATTAPASPGSPVTSSRKQRQGLSLPRPPQGPHSSGSSQRFLPPQNSPKKGETRREARQGRRHLSQQVISG